MTKKIDIEIFEITKNVNISAFLEKKILGTKNLKTFPFFFTHYTYFDFYFWLTGCEVFRSLKVPIPRHKGPDNLSK